LIGQEPTGVDPKATFDDAALTSPFSDLAGANQQRRSLFVNRHRSFE
jgi:hypothetical protein